MIIDVNVNLSRWPARRLPWDETPLLVDKLREAQVARAWASSFDALLHRDIAGVNERLTAECQKYGTGLLVAFGAVNPTLPDWVDDLRRCHEEHGMPGIRLFPSYHGYTLDEPLFEELLARAEERGLIVQLAVRMEDDRTQHPRLRAPDVDTEPLVELLAARPRLKFVILNGLRSLRGNDLKRLTNAGDVYFEIAMLEGIGGISRLLESIPVDRVLFGSYFPFFYLEAALLKLRESSLAPAQLEAITRENAERLLR